MCIGDAVIEMNLAHGQQAGIGAGKDISCIRVSRVILQSSHFLISRRKVLSAVIEKELCVVLV